MCEKRFGPLLAILLAAMGWFAWSQRLILDDAFISFRYARNLVEGLGLVWNAGERVEGYTNFLWTLLLSLPIVAKIDPVTFCYAIGPVLAVATLYFTARIALLLFESRPLALLAVLLAGSNPSFAAFATGGLETMFAACLQTALLWAVLSAYRRRTAAAGLAAAVSCLAACALLTRLDSALVVAPALAVAAWIIVTAQASFQRKAIAMSLLAAPVGVALAAWFVWRLSYYGMALPNTYNAKLGAGPAWAAGFHYLRAFFGSTLTFPFLLLVAAGFRRFTGPVAFAAVTLAATCAYLAAAGGDFMEFRLLVPTIPVLVLLIVWVTFRFVAQREVRAALMALAAVGWVHHSLTFEYTEGIETVHALSRHMSDPSQDWIGIGKELGRVLGGSPGLTIATSASGAIPYYSRLAAIDMLGLTDPWIAAHGIEVRSQPGHVRAAPFGYLVSKHVNLILGHPWVVGPSDPPWNHPQERGLEGFGYILEVGPGELPASASYLLIPMEGGRSLVTLYLLPHPSVEAAIAANRWVRLPVMGTGG